MLSERVAGWLATLDAPDFVVAHGGILRALLHLLAGLPPHDAPHLAVPQDRVILFTAQRGADDLSLTRPLPSRLRHWRNRRPHMSHNTFGHLFRVTTWGESHGPAIGCVVDGCPPSIPISEAEIQALSRQAPARAVALHHAAARAGRGEDPLRRVRGRDDRRPGHHRHADRAA